jgi:NAD(P)-dependent dehydrogenase (short-subunit alcohol dehydrogenase family)
MMKYEGLFSIRGKVAIVTGGSRGLGQTLARSFALSGADVAIFARNPDDLERAAVEIQRESKGRVLAVSGDISLAADVQRLFETVGARLGPVDILVANAALINRPREETWDLSEETWQRTIDTTLTGTFLTCRLAAAEMVERGQGKIICIASTSSVIASLGHSPYIAAKAGVLGFVRALALEAAPYGVNVNAIGPTFIRTEMTQASLDDPERRKQIIAQLPLGRPLEPEDLVGACLFLASPASDMVTGQLLLVDAGHTVH